MNSLQDFTQLVQSSLENDSFIKLTLSKTRFRDELKNVYIRPLEIKNQQLISFNFRYQTNDQTKNLDKYDALVELQKLLSETFQNATLFTSEFDYHLMVSKKGKVNVKKAEASQQSGNKMHDKAKTKRSSYSAKYLQLLGITDHNGELIPKMADKFRQINKYLEIMEGLITSIDFPKQPQIVDMGSGKGYLTFALYDYLSNLGYEVSITGIELRKELVDICNTISKECGYDRLSFVQQPIQEYNNDAIDVLIALHACDTATDDAIAKGLHANAKVIVCAPCCHKQIRQQVKSKVNDDPILKYGIFKERQFEMVTDTIRALILEREGYESKIFEFVSNEHTRKNIMLIGVNKGKQAQKAGIDKKIIDIKKSYNVDFHYLEKQIK